MTAARHTTSLSRREARALALSAQGIGARPRQPGRAALRRLLLSQAAVQLDSVNAVARSHELVPFSRLGAYRVCDLYRVVYRERLMFEYWAHAMSWVPLADFRFFLPRMERRRVEPRGWWRDVREQHADLYSAVLDRIRQEGPLASSDFEDTRTGRGSWWDLKPAKLVLEDLFDQGLLMVSDRRSGFQRVYDLTERVLPTNLELTRPSDAETSRHFLLRAAAALGVGTAADLADYFRLSRQSARPALRELVEDGDLVEVAVEGWREPAYACPESLRRALRRPRHRPLLLSPFDPLVWERRRALRLFGFDYRIEIYTPEAKRRYGYYVLPLLAGGELIGRVDVRNDRANRVLRVPAVHLEPEVGDGCIPAAAAAIGDLARFLHCLQVDITRTDPAWLIGPLRARISRMQDDRLERPERATIGAG